MAHDSAESRMAAPPRNPAGRRSPRPKAGFAVLAALALTAPATAQITTEAPSNDELPATRESSLERTLERAELDRGFAQGESEARKTLETWAGCVARGNAAENDRVLKMDFTSKAYDRALKSLADEGRSCARFRGKLRSAGLLLAGEMAEALIKSDATPVAARLVAAAGTPATQGFSLPDKVAICVVRSVPDQVATMFATERDSAEESAAIEALATPAAMCARLIDAKAKLSVSPSGLRAMVATAAYRSIYAPGGEA